MTIEEGITYGKEQLEIFGGKHAEFIKMAIHALEMQKKLAEFSGMDICNWVEDYDYDETNVSEYEYEADVDDEFYHIKHPKARKEHICDLCGSKIPFGQSI